MKDRSGKEIEAGDLLFHQANVLAIVLNAFCKHCEVLILSDGMKNKRYYGNRDPNWLREKWTVSEYIKIILPTYKKKKKSLDS